MTKATKATGSVATKAPATKATKGKTTPTALSGWALTVLKHIAGGTNTRKALIVATGRGTGWAKLLGAHTKGFAGVQGPGLVGAGLLAYNAATRQYTLTAAGKAALGK